MRSMLTALAVLTMAAPAVPQEKPAEEQAAPGRILELYDIRDLIYDSPDFPGVDLSLAVDAVKSGAGVGDRKSPSEPLVAAARALLTPRSTLEEKDQLLVIRATEEEHRAVKELLALFRRRMGFMIRLEARFLQTDVALRDGKPGLMSVIAETEVPDLLRRVTDAKGSVFTVPRLTVLNGQLGNCFVGSTMDYVRDFRIALDKSGALRAEPIVATARDGVALNARPVLMSAEKEEILLEDLQVSLAEFRQKKLRELVTPYGIVQDPELQTVKVSLQATLQKGQALLVGPLSKPWSRKEDPKVWVLLMQKVTALPDPPRQK